ncbi:hypothetical protein K490DRAFT_12622, partial [Saccharata proteae CBS 121410]
MQALRRSTLVAARTLRVRTLQQTRRAAHDKAHGPAAGAEEHFGKGFYITIASVPCLLALYKFTQQAEDPNNKPIITRLIEKYQSYEAKNAERNDLHVMFMEQAAEDRLLLNTAPRKFEAELSYPEFLNHGSPYNVPTGHYVNLDKVIAKYQKMNYEENERKHQALRDGTLKAEQP